MMGRNIRTRLPMTDRHLRPEWPSHDSVRMSDEAHKNRNKHYYDLKHGVRPLPELHPGDTVRVKDDSQKKWDETATVIGPAGTRGLTRYKPLVVCCVVTVVICPWSPSHQWANLCL